VVEFIKKNSNNDAIKVKSVKDIGEGSIIVIFDIVGCSYDEIKDNIKQAEENFTPFDFETERGEFTAEIFGAAPSHDSSTLILKLSDNDRNTIDKCVNAIKEFLDQDKTPFLYVDREQVFNEAEKYIRKRISDKDFSTIQSINVSFFCTIK